MQEQRVYEAIVTQFIAAFYPPCLKRLTTVDALCEGVAFQAKGTQVVQPGWTELFPKKGRSAEEEEEQDLPVFEVGEQGPHEPFLREGKTNPPKHYTENSLLGAMEAAGKMVEDDALREALKERGIGTPATRAAIIETLLTRGYIRREKKQLRCTDMGRCLIALIRDPLLKSPEMTGEWEEKLKQIERQALDPAQFMQGIKAYIQALIQNSAGHLEGERLGVCPLCGKEVIRGKSAYGCSDWKAGCPFVLDPAYKGLTLSHRQVQFLLQRRILPAPVSLDGAPRLLILSTQGAIMDLALPSAQGQKSAYRKSSGGKPSGGKPSGGKPSGGKPSGGKSSVRKPSSGKSSR
jgi:DNA topoisomerase-3